MSFRINTSRTTARSSAPAGRNIPACARLCDRQPSSPMALRPERCVADDVNPFKTCVDEENAFLAYQMRTYISPVWRSSIARLREQPIRWGGQENPYQTSLNVLRC